MNTAPATQAITAAHEVPAACVRLLLLLAGAVLCLVLFSSSLRAAAATLTAEEEAAETTQAEATEAVSADDNTAATDATEATFWSPNAFHAEYRIKYNYRGIPIRTTAVRSLTRDENDLWHFMFGMQFMFMVRIEESASFAISGDEPPLPRRYKFYRRSFGNKRAHQLHYDHDNQVLRFSGDTEGTRELTEPMLNPVTWHPVLINDLIRDATPGRALQYPIFDGRKDKTYTLTIREPEQLRLLGRDYDTVVLEQDGQSSDLKLTRIWLAPELNWLIVQVANLDQKDRWGYMTLKSYTPGN